MMRHGIFLFFLFLILAGGGNLLHAQEVPDMLDVLDEIILRNVDLRKAPPAEVTALLQKTASSWKKKKINLVFSVTANRSFPSVTLKRDAISISEFLDILDSSYGIRFRYYKYAERILLLNNPDQLLDRVFLLDQGKEMPWTQGSLRSLLKKHRVAFPQGASVTVNRKKGVVFLRNTWRNLEKTEKILGVPFYLREEDIPRKVPGRKDAAKTEKQEYAAGSSGEKEETAAEEKKEVNTRTLLQNVLQQKKARISRKKK